MSDYCAFCGVYADAGRYCRECMDKLELHHKQEAARDILQRVKERKQVLMLYQEKNSRAVIYFQKLEREIKEKYLEGE